MWDWCWARVQTFVRVTDTGLLYGYRLFRKVTADWLEPYIRVAALVVVMGLVAWAIHTIRTPRPGFIIPAMDHFAALPAEPVNSSPLAIKGEVSAPKGEESSLEMKQCQDVAFSMTAIAKAHKQTIATLEAELQHYRSLKYPLPELKPVVVKVKRKAKAVTSAREDMARTLAR